MPSRTDSGAAAMRDPVTTPSSSVNGLDNPAYSSLTGFHSGLAAVRGNARRYPADVAPFLGLPAVPVEQDWADAAGLVTAGEVVALVRQTVDVPPSWEVIQSFGAVRMTAETVRAAADPDAVPLGPDDVPDMLRLTAETRPGPFLPRTIELGSYLGIRRGGELIAMAGERLRAPGWTEVSAVCTAPGHRGEGLGTRLVHAVVGGIEARGDRAFLHTSAENTNAIRLYEALGFALVRRLTITTVTPRTR